MITLLFTCVIVAAKVHEAEVVIIGGGIAGIAAAHTLVVGHGLNDIVIIESENYLGGRMRKTEVTLQDGRDLVLEEGMNWITCAGAENPVYRLATKYNISMVLQDWENVALYGNGTKLSTDLTLPRWDVFYEAWYELLEVEEDLNLQNIGIDESWSLFDAFRYFTNWVITTPLDYAIEWFDLDWSFIVGTEETSAKFAIPAMKDCELPTYLIVDQRGASHMVEQMALEFLDDLSDSRLLLDTKVNSIVQTKDQVEIHTDDHVYNAKYIINTVSVDRHEDLNEPANQTASQSDRHEDLIEPADQTASQSGILDWNTYVIYGALLYEFLTW